jgi:hypothetical protein
MMRACPTHSDERARAGMRTLTRRYTFDARTLRTRLDEVALACARQARGAGKSQRAMLVHSGCRSARPPHWPRRTRTRPHRCQRARTPACRTRRRALCRADGLRCRFVPVCDPFAVLTGYSRGTHGVLTDGLHCRFVPVAALVAAVDRYRAATAAVVFRIGAVSAVVHCSKAPYCPVKPPIVHCCKAPYCPLL